MIFVTGADGFIGSHVVEELVREGRRVRAFVCYNSFNSWGWLDDLDADLRRELDVVAGDVRDYASVREAMRGCHSAMHLAALIAIPYSYRSPESYVDTNVKGTLHVVQAARELGLERVVHTSTSEVYGSARFVPIHEEHPLCAQSPYAASKIGADQIALSFQRSFGLPVIVVRPFNTYGPRQSARAVIPAIIAQVAAGNSRIALGALHPTRDFSFVTDTARGLIAALDAPGGAGEVVNLGSGFEIAIGELAEFIANVMGREIQVVSDPQRLRPADSEVERLLADNAKARQLLGWTPRYASREGLRAGLAETAKWFSDPRNLERYKTDIYNL